MPVKLPYCSLLQVLLRGGDVVALWQVLNDLFAKPPS
jgi:hypothetical protein